MNKVINNSLLYLAQIAISGVLMLVLMPIVGCFSLRSTQEFYGTGGYFL